MLVLRFLLNDKVVEEVDLPADLTVLDYLRNRQQLTGSKEGCASGDCGACTVVVAAPVDGRLAYESINSCIAFVGDLHGKQLITVEHLAQGDQLHPVQQAMVDCHGSQCGFCTPGFVMSLFSMTKQSDIKPGASLRQQIDEHLGGNLCRCTGYRPIVDAATLAINNSVDQPSDQFTENENAVIETLQSIKDESIQRNFHRPRQLTDLYALRKQYPDAPLLAGGTDLALEVTQNLKQYPNIICLKNIAELNYRRSIDDQWLIGAGYTLSDFLSYFGALNSDIKTLLQRFGSTQVRNQGTVGGNIANASPIGDLPPLCIALGAELVLESEHGKRQIALEDFFINYKKTALKPDEIVSELRIPHRALKTSADNNPQCKVYKISKRNDDDISAVCAVFSYQMDGDRIKEIKVAFGGMAAIPKRAIHLEDALRGKALTAAVLVAADSALAQDFQPISDARASAEYRLQVSRNLLRRLALEIKSKDGLARVHDHVS